MRKIILLAGMAAFSWASLFAGHAEFGTAKDFAKVEKEVTTGTFSITKKDVDVSLAGFTRQDYIAYDKIYTLRASNDDQLTAFRNKSSIDVAASYGKQKYGKSAADSFIRLTNYGYWKYEGYYTPFINSDNSKDNRSLSMLTYMEELWIDLHLGTFFKAYDNWVSLEDHPVSLKMGYFPYELGRGVAMGDFPMHIPYLGWDSFNYDDTRYNHPGILIHGDINKDIAYELYYSKQTEVSGGLSQTWKTINQDRTDGRRKWRGISKDRDLWTAKLDMKHQKDWGDLHVQPYGMYIDAPELQIEFEGDANSRLGTVGMMVEYKKNRFEINAEVAGQFGHQNVFAIDRNRQVASMAVDGTSCYFHTHAFYDANGYGYAETKAPVNGTATVANVKSFYSKGGVDSVTKQWIPAVTKNGDQVKTIANVNVAAYPPTATGDSGSSTSVYNSNVTGNNRFRDGYRVDYRGFMGLVDMKYEFEDVPVTIASAVGYVSGDKYPYNTEQDKRYKAFVPYGDKNYVGKFVRSQVVMDARKMPRPVDISLKDQYAHNNVQDMSNLAFIGTGVQWRPFENKDKLLFESNVLWFWEATTLKKWDKEGKLPSGFYGDKSWGAQPDGRTGTIDWTKGSHHVGWMSNKDASRMLGTEVNFEVRYKPVENCLFFTQIGCFIPGQLYKDLDGQPNENTIKGPKASEGVYGLGHDPVWRLAFCFKYEF